MKAIKQKLKLEQEVGSVSMFCLWEALKEQLCSER